MSYQQPDYRIPVPPIDSSGRPLGAVSVQVEAAHNSLGVEPGYTQPDIKPAAPASNQFGTLIGSLGASKKTNADGTTSNL